MKILTIIVPTYNMEKYLQRCLDSLIIEDRKLLDTLEVIVVNDGSKDSSSKIAHVYEDKYPSVFHVIDKENGNYGSCVNVGIEHAKGKYLRLLDADDWFEKDELLHYLRKLLDIDTCDIVITNYTKQYSDGKYKTLLARNIDYGKIYDMNTMDFCELKNSDMLWMHAISLNTKFAQNIGWENQTGISYTDAEYCYFPLSYAETICFLNINLYQYFLGREGQTVSEEGVKKGQQAFYKVGIRLLKDYNDRQFTEHRKKSLSLIISNVVYNIYANHLIFSKKNPFLDFFEEINMEVNKSKTVYNLVNKFTYKKIPYVLLWKYLGIKMSFFFGK